MGAAKLGLLGACVAAALLAGLWWLRDVDGVAVGSSSARPDVARPEIAAIDLPRSARGPAVAPLSPGSALPPPRDTRASEAELRAQLADVSYARLGGALVDHLAARGLARADSERVVRRFFVDNAQCLFDALRVEADAQSVSHDQALDAIEADVHETDGPLLAAVIDLRAVEQRVTPCALAAAQQAGIEPAAFDDATRAAIGRRARR